MGRARVCFEFGEHLFLIGRTRVGWAMRSLNSREVSLLQPFPSITAAQQMCKALARAQVIAFSDDEVAKVNGLHKRPRKRRAGRRRREPRTLVEPMSMPAARPSAPARPSMKSVPNPPARGIPRRASLEDRRPAPDVTAALDAAITRFEESPS
jgi:hypothetical protein